MAWFAIYLILLLLLYMKTIAALNSYKKYAHKILNIMLFFLSGETKKLIYATVWLDQETEIPQEKLLT